MNEPNTLLRVDRLSVRNFRCFAECSLELHPTLTVLVADNALGKTALLDALRLALNVFVTTMGRSKQCHGFERTDVHLVRGTEGRMQPQLPTLFAAEGWVDGEHIAWSRVLKSNGPHARSSTKHSKAMRTAALRLSDRPDVRENTRSDQPTMLPIVAFYGTGRLWDELRPTKGKRWLASTSPVRVSAYLDCLSPSSSYKSFTTWYEKTAEAVRDPRFKAVGRDERPENYLVAVRDAVRSVLQPTGWTAIDWEFGPKDADGQPLGRGYVVVEHSENGRLPLSHLSDGVRNMVALVADLTHRCVRLNPHLGEAAARLTPGILMIDEVDMHLHPRWQQLVVGLLQASFPKMQLVLSTHSPHVLSTVDFSSIRVIRLDGGRGEAKRPDFQTLGDESAGVLANVMAVDPVPDVEPARLLSHYRALVQNSQDQNDDAQATWHKLLEHFGAGHHLLQEAAILRRLQEFKRQKDLG
jgi:predicted ATP-binding protein involved in virulence